MVLGDGPEDSRILFIGEGPAYHEVKAGRPFVGKSGMELDRQYLPLARLCRSDVRVDNAHRCALPQFRNPEVEEAEGCVDWWLQEYLSEHQPEVIVTLGAVACHALFPSCNLSLEHGYPRQENLYGGLWKGIHVAMYHPAAALRDAEYMIPMQADFARLALITRGQFQAPVDEYPEPKYVHVTRAEDLRGILRRWEAMGAAAKVGQDTEALPLTSWPWWEPWCFSASFEPGTGFVVLAKDWELVGMWVEYVRAKRPLTVYHNALFDLDIQARMGIEVVRYTDTMQLAYVLGDQPQGLKDLAYRLCGMKMQDFEDLVMPYARRSVLEWGVTTLQYMLCVAEDEPEKPKLPRRPTKKQLAEDPDAGLRVELERICLAESYKEKKQAYQSSPVVRGYSKLARLMKSMVENRNISPWSRVAAWEEEERAAVESIGGKLPVMSIDKVPLDKAVYYAGRDPDATLRVFTKLQGMAGDLRRRVRG
jgi:uracil-DNA glycosylase